MSWWKKILLNKSSNSPSEEALISPKPPENSNSEWNEKTSLQEIENLKNALADKDTQIQELEKTLTFSNSEYADFLQEILLVFQELESSMQDPKIQFGFIHETENSMGEVVESMNQILESMNEMESSEHMIGNIGNIIKDFAADTKVLSLNANIEAARAGTAGREFAVVAKEVYNISREIDKATEKINSIVDSVSTTTHETSNQIAEISHLVIGLNDTFSEFSENVESLFSNMRTQNTQITQRIHQLLKTNSHSEDSVELF